MSNKSPILFFDGHCNLCDDAVSFLIKRNAKLNYQYASLQGQSAAKLLPCVYTENLKSVILLKDGQLLSKSEAAFEVMKDLGGLWGFFSRFFLILPLSVSNFFYQLISRLRYRLWGKREQC